MAHLLRGHAVTAATLASLGSGLVGAAFFAPLPAHIAYVPGSTLALVTGGVLLAGALLAVAFGIQRDAGPAPSVLAHVAFSSRAHAPEPEVVAPLPARRAAKPSNLPPEILRIDDQIRDVTREINKAGVMLATGKLSREGYTAYVEDLKRQRGDLETARMEIETRRHHA